MYPGPDPTDAKTTPDPRPVPLRRASLRTGPYDPKLDPRAART